MVADAGGVHVFAHQAVAHGRVGEGCIARRGEGAVADDGYAVSDLARDADRLAAPRVVACLERAGQKIEQADFRLGDDFGVETAGIDGKRRASQRSRQRNLAWSGRSDRHGNRSSRADSFGLAAHFDAGPFLQHFRDRSEVGRRAIFGVGDGEHLPDH